jgi:hypothetical protein
MKNIKRIVCLATLIGTALLFAAGMCAGSNVLPTQAALPTGASSDECSVAAITVTGKLGVSPGVSDTLVGSAASRAVYFSNPNPSGTITVSTLISDMAATCYVWASPAFSITDQIQLTTTASALLVNIPYPVGDAHGPTVTLVLTFSPNITGSALAPHQIVTLTFIQDRTPATWTIDAPAQSVGRTPVTIDWSASDADSGAAWLALLHRQWPATEWATFTITQVAHAPTGTLAFIPPTVWLTEPITYELAGQVIDYVGNLEPPISPEAYLRVSPARVYLPIIMQPLINGDFEQGWLNWTHGQGPFLVYTLTHGGGLSQTIALFEGSHRALLGSPDYDNKNANIPVGYAFISRVITVQSSMPVLAFSYRVHSFDTSFGTTKAEYFDTFEVSIDKSPEQVTRAERDGAYGCSGAALNPDNVTRTPTTSGLIVCGGAPQGNTSEWDSSWHTVRISLAAFANSAVTLYWAVWSREYDPPYYDDSAYYNTYSYVDDVTLTAGP